MDQCFRIVLWMFFLIGYLQAKPVCPDLSFSAKPSRFNMANLGFCILRQNVKCEHNVTFSSPTNVKENCHNAALKCIKEGLESAKMKCKDDEQRINDTLEALGMDSQPTQEISSECKLETEEFQFERFVNQTESFVQLLNDFNTNAANSGN